MESLLTVPKKYNRCGIKVKCLKCKWQLGSGKCHQDKDKTQSISKCEYKDQHRFNLVVSVPNGNNTRRMKILDTRDFNAAMEEMNHFRQELNVSGYHNTNKETQAFRPTYVNYVVAYLDTLSGINTPLHLIRKVTPKHLNEITYLLKMFRDILEEEGYNIETLLLKDIGDYDAELLYKHLIYDLELSETTYNRYFTNMKTFYNWCGKVMDYDGKNPFKKAKLIFNKPDVRIFTKTEFERILEATTPENGTSDRGDENRNYYRPWLIDAYRLCLETGERGEPYVNLKWNDIITVENGVELFGISNLKPNRINSGRDTGKYTRYIPITKSLKKLLVELGYNEKKGTDAYVLEGDVGLSRKYLMEITTRSFSHYAMKAGVTGLTIKNLRKTYVTKLTLAMGANSKIFTGHSDSKVMENHYLSQAYLAANLKEFDVL